MKHQIKQEKFDGPIPGENYTADVKNYPWHRPPMYTDYVEIVDRAIHRLDTPERTSFVIALLEQDETIIDIVTGLSRIAVATGKMSINHAILASGPIARMIEVIAEQAGIDYERGWKQEPHIITSELITALGGTVDAENLDESILDTEIEDAEDVVDSGLMTPTEGAAATETQDEMLGSQAEEEEAI